jgi:hypothetical protein
MEPETRGGTLVEVDGMLLAESAAIVEFILARYGHGRLQHAPDHAVQASSLDRLEKVLALVETRLSAGDGQRRSGLDADVDLKSRPYLKTA